MSDSNFDDLFGTPEDDGDFAAFNPDDEDAPDAGTVAFMDQQAAEFNQLEHEFADRYGFVHKCRCDQDYSAGNMVEVTECYANMTVEALEACATLKAENTLLRKMIVSALGVGLGELEQPETDPEVEGSETD